jgi:hypothetical protein
MPQVVKNKIQRHPVCLRLLAEAVIKNADVNGVSICVACNREGSEQSRSVEGLDFRRELAGLVRLDQSSRSGNIRPEA